MPGQALLVPQGPSSELLWSDVGCQCMLSQRNRLLVPQLVAQYLWSYTSGTAVIAGFCVSCLELASTIYLGDMLHWSVMFRQPVTRCDLSLVYCVCV